MNKLAEGVVGSEIVKHFAAKYGKVAVDAKSLGPMGDWHGYRITFDGGAESEYRVKFGRGLDTKIYDSAPIVNFVQTAATAVTLGDFIPAHDETYDLAAEIGNKLTEFRTYIASERDTEQADDAVRELLTAFLEAGKVEPTNTDRA